MEPINKKKIAILGATGSIGKSAVDIISRDNENFEVILLSAHSNRYELKKLSDKFPEAVCILTQTSPGDEKLLMSIEELKPDITINGIAGAAGLLPSLAAINAGSQLALANKETIVIAGPLVTRRAKEKNVKIIPVDSEHSAVFHLIQRENIDNISEIILTASGGPFRNFSMEQMRDVTVEDALNHPTWNMGKKITIDSASMANKGLEIIEACVLFNVSAEKIKVVIHPQSIIHSMIRLCNGAVYAQMYKPDMRHPIHDAVYYPQTKSNSLEPLNFDALSLEFFKPDTQKFPMLKFAYDAAKLKGFYTCAYNAANEIAVWAFLERKIKFLDIFSITEQVLQSDWSGDEYDLEAILSADKKARAKAESIINR